MSFFHARPEYNPNMSSDEAARVWMILNECTDNGRAAINYEKNREMSVNYKETPHGIVILLHNDTCIPVPYKYDGSTNNLLCNV